MTSKPARSTAAEDWLFDKLVWYCIGGFIYSAVRLCARVFDWLKEGRWIHDPAFLSSEVPETSWLGVNRMMLWAAGQPAWLFIAVATPLSAWLVWLVFKSQE